MGGISAGEKIDAGLLSRLLDEDTLTANTVNITTVETVVMTVTADLISGEKYCLRSIGRYDTSTNGDDAFPRIREDSVSGTQLIGDIFDIPDAAMPLYKVYETFYTAVATGAKTFVATLIRNAGAGNLVISATASVPAHLSLWHTAQV